MAHTHTHLSLLHTYSAWLQSNKNQQHSHASLSFTHALQVYSVKKANSTHMPLLHKHKHTHTPHTNTQLQSTHVKRLLLKLTREPNTWRIEALMQKLCWPENKHDTLTNMTSHTHKYGIQPLHTHKHDMTYTNMTWHSHKHDIAHSQTWHSNMTWHTHKHMWSCIADLNRMILCVVWS